MNYSSKHLVKLIVMLCLIFAPAWMMADRITLQNDRVIEGRIVQENETEIVFEIGGIRQTFQKSNIRSIVRENTRENSPASEQIVSAETLLENGDILEAQKVFNAALGIDENVLQSESNLARRLIAALSNFADSTLADGDGYAAIETADLIESAETSNIISTLFPNNQTEYRAKTQVLRGRGWAMIAEDLRSEGNFEESIKAYEQAENYFLQNTQTFAELKFEEARTRIALSENLVRNNELENAKSAALTALENFQAAIDNAQSNANLVEQSRSEINRIRSVVIPNINIALRPNPTPTPVPTPVPTPFPTPVPTPIPDVQADQTEEGMLSGIFTQENEDKLNEWVQEVLGEGTTFVDALILIGIFILIYWIIPSIFFKYRVSKLDFHADQWASKVWWMGTFTFLGYLYSIIANRSKVTKKEKTKHPCPHCGHSLDDPMQYDKLQFEYCPSCSGEIKPIYDIAEYINILASNLRLEADKVDKGTESLNTLVKKDGMQRLVRALITSASRTRASDLHIEPGQKTVKIRQRVDGIMVDMVELNPTLGPAIVSALKVNADLDISEKRKPQDGSMQVMVDDHPLDLRIATSPSQVGETATLRLLDSRTIEMSTKNLGMTKSTRQIFESAVDEPHGLVLVTGPTGSGKTTTLYIALQSLTKGDKNIISIEDPIEFRIAGINQIQVNPTAGLTFASGLRSMLRQDPDVIMVGEIRDGETAEIAVNAAQTGHLVFSTLHTIDAASSVTRLFDLKISPRQFADALSLVVAQRLIRLVCPHCAKEVKISEEKLDELSIPTYDYDKYEFVEGQGCDHCLSTGFYGRTGIFEMLLPNSSIRSFLQKGEFSTVELRELAISNGMRTLREEALILLRQKLTTYEEVLRVTK